VKPPSDRDVEVALATLRALVPLQVLAELAARLDASKRDRIFGSLTLELHMSRGEIRSGAVTQRLTWQVPAEPKP
jgi:hypothetical protein